MTELHRRINPHSKHTLSSPSSSSSSNNSNNGGVTTSIPNNVRRSPPSKFVWIVVAVSVFIVLLVIHLVLLGDGPGIIGIIGTPSKSSTNRSTTGNTATDISDGTIIHSKKSMNMPKVSTTKSPEISNNDNNKINNNNNNNNNNKSISSNNNNNNNPNNNNNNNNNNEKGTIGYAISLTGCPKDEAAAQSLLDGAAVLKHSIHLSSNQNTNTHSTSQYNYQMYAIVHPSAEQCAQPLSTIGYKLLIKDVPVPVKDIEGEFLRSRVEKNGCCGEKEFIKLWAYMILDHEIVVHLDIDTFVLQPLDVLFDAMLDDSTTTTRTNKDESSLKEQLNVMWPSKPLPTPQINAYFTRDYNMVRPGKQPVGVQGGFLILRPSKQTFDQFTSIIQKGDYTKGGGWGNAGYAFYGSMTFQGIIPYYYDIIAPNTSIELNRCVYNQMADNPRSGRTVNNVVSGDCRDGREECEDCRERSIGEVMTAHFTLCQKPWECLPHSQDLLQHRLCRKLFGEWYRIRADMEMIWRGGGTNGDYEVWKEKEMNNDGSNGAVGDGNYEVEVFRGFCKGSGGKGYIPINYPAN